MQQHIQHSGLFRNLNLSRATRQEYRRVFNVAFDALEANLYEEISNITRDCNSVVAEAGQLPEAQQDSTLASALEFEIDEAEDTYSHSSSECIGKCGLAAYQ